MCDNVDAGTATARPLIFQPPPCPCPWLARAPTQNYTYSRGARIESTSLLGLCKEVLHRGVLHAVSKKWRQNRFVWPPCDPCAGFFSSLRAGVGWGDLHHTTLSKTKHIINFGTCFLNFPQWGDVTVGHALPTGVPREASPTPSRVISPRLQQLLLQLPSWLFFRRAPLRQLNSKDDEKRTKKG